MPRVGQDPHVGVPGRLASREFDGCDAQGPNVDLLIVPAGTDHLGRHVERGAAHRHSFARLARPRHRVHEFAHTEVANVANTGSRNEDVVALDITVDDAALVQAGQCNTHVMEHDPRNVFGQWGVHDELLCGSAVYKLHDDGEHLGGLDSRAMLLGAVKFPNRSLVELGYVCRVSHLARAPRRLNLSSQTHGIAGRNDLYCATSPAVILAQPYPPVGALANQALQGVPRPRDARLDDPAWQQNALELGHRAPKRPEGFLWASECRMRAQSHVLVAIGALGTFAATAAAAAANVGNVERKLFVAGASILAYCAHVYGASGLRAQEDGMTVARRGKL
mmetsp:Transcript_121873/g.344697  ORF Transcript_121873/g.344697 Transcript_121873/m.344697 type:complete len:335 (+) Transcript_121873:531-1535(+)